MAAISNALADALGIRFTALPMSPPRVLAAIKADNGDATTAS
jgi:CO/xanthine dehydrogenase Mo-binding subunit